MKDIAFSIVIPTHNRSDLLESLLRTLAVAQQRYSGATEVIVVDSSRGDEALAIRSICQGHNVRLFQGANHVCHKRNIGIREAYHDHVLFTDSDCEVESDLLSQHALVYQSGGDEIGGVLGLTTIFGDSAPVWRTLRLDSSFTAAFAIARWLQDAPWGTCTNLSFRRDVLLEVGGFDEDWPLVVYGEDVDLGLRINNAGFRIRCNPKAVVRHNYSSVRSVNQAFLRKLQNGQADYYLGHKHPDCLSPEFPGWTGVALLLFVVLLVKSLATHSLYPMLLLAITLTVGVLCQATLMAMAGAAGWRTVPQHATVVLLEAAYEAGRLFESFRHGTVRRLWTKFVYVERQLVGERDKRVRQMWACVLALVCLLTLSKGLFH